MHTAWRPCGFIAKCADMVPLVSRFCPHLLSAHGPAARVKNLPSATHFEGAHDYTPIVGLFGCCTLKSTSSPRHHLRDSQPSQARPPPAICSPRSPAMRTCCSRVLSLHTFRIALWCICRCSGPQLCTRNTSSNPSLSGLHRLNCRCRYLLDFSRPVSTPTRPSALTTVTTPYFTGERKRF